MRNILEKYITIALFIGISITLQGCANTTSAGATGIERSQLMLIPTKTLHDQSAQSFSEMNAAAQKKNLLNTDAKLTDRINKIAFSLIGYVGIFREDAYNWEWEISVYDNDQINAFCAPGGKIGIFTGLIKKLKLNDHEIAAVIGHEIAHALREHSREKISQQMVSTLATTAVGAAIGISPQLLESGSSLLVHLPNSRAMEIEADIIGLELMARAGYDPRQAASLWKKMAAYSGDTKSNVLLSTHPDAKARILQIEENVPKVLHYYTSHISPKK